MSTTKVEKSGVGFSVTPPGGPVAIELRLHHDTILGLKGVQLSFELLNGISPQQAKKIVETLNENVLGLVVSSKSDDKMQAASG
jgi:hypothetical protein